MTTLTAASRQWATRPDDERFTSLTDMLAHFRTVRRESKQVVVPSRRIHALPDPDNKGMTIVGPSGYGFAPTHYSFGQIAQLAEAPGGYLRTLPAPIAADCINYGLQFKRQIEDIGILLRKNSENILRAATGPRYGRIWNDEITTGLVERFGDGVSGDWRVPGEFKRAVTVTKANTTLYASDRDMWVFLADETHRIEIPNRRGGQPGSLARGFFLWNSEVGAATFGLGTFLFDYVCCNRMVWGAEQYQEVRIRHTPSAPVKWLDEMAPALTAYANSSAAGVVKAIANARAKRVDNLDDFLASRFSKRLVPVLKATHEREEGRPIETLWDVSTAATAYARGLTHQDARVDIERAAGKVIDLAA